MADAVLRVNDIYENWQIKYVKLLPYNEAPDVYLVVNEVEYIVSSAHSWKMTF